MALSSLLRAGVAPVGVPFASELGGLLEELEGLEGLTPIRSHCCGPGVPLSHCCGLVVAFACGSGACWACWGTFSLRSWPDFWRVWRVLERLRPGKRQP